MLLTSGVTSLFCMYLIQSNIYELLAVQSKNGFPFSDCLISIDTKISIVLCSRISFFLFTPRQSSDNPFDSSCEPLAYNIVYSMDYWWPVSLKTVCVCVYTYTELEVGVLIEVYSGYHMSRLFIYIKYTGRIWISLLVQFIAHQTCWGSLWREQVFL